MKKMKTTREVLQACKMQKKAAMEKVNDLWKSQEDDRKLVAEMMEKAFGKVRRPLYVFFCILLMTVKFSVYAAIELVRFAFPFVRRGIVFTIKFIALYFSWIFGTKSNKENTHQPQHATHS